MRWLAAIGCVCLLLSGCAGTRLLSAPPSSGPASTQPSPTVDVPPIAFVTDAGGNAAIALASPDGSRRLLAPTANDDVSEFAPVWSPDGSQLAHHRITAEGTDELVLADPHAGTARVLAQVGPPSASDPRVSWSPSSDRVAFWSTSGADNEIWIVATETGDAINVTNDPAADRYPAWSPDGTLICFWSDRGGDGAIWVIAPEGGAARRLAVVGRSLGPATWSPDGQRLAVPIEQAGERWTMRIVDRSGDTLTDIVGEGSVLSPTWSPDGASLAYWDVSETFRHLFVADGDGADPRTVGPTPTSGGSLLASHLSARWPAPASWSPASDRLAAEWADAGEVALLVIDVDNGHWTSLSSTGVNDGSPAWRPAETEGS